MDLYCGAVYDNILFWVAFLGLQGEVGDGESRADIAYVF